VCIDCNEPHKIVLVGGHNRKREHHVSTITKERVGIWGFDWHRANLLRNHHKIHESRTFGGDAAAIYSSADISLNIVDDLNMPGHNMRTFEIPASGGVMLATFTEEQADFFPEAEAAWYYKQPQDIDAILERTLADQELLKSMREKALQLARDHTYDKRVETLLKEIKT
jgi:spore maturation protein CgeB